MAAFLLIASWKIEIFSRPNNEHHEKIKQVLKLMSEEIFLTKMDKFSPLAMLFVRIEYVPILFLLKIYKSGSYMRQPKEWIDTRRLDETNY